MWWNITCFCSGGGISLGGLCHGPDVDIVASFGLMNEHRLDLRGLNRYYMGSRGYTSCWNVDALMWSLRVCGYDAEIKKQSW